MTLYDLNTEKDIETAFHSAVRCFRPPAGLKEAVAERLSNLRGSETRDDAVQTTEMNRRRKRAFPTLLKWATACAAASLLIGAAIVVFLRSGEVGPQPGNDLPQTSRDAPAVRLGALTPEQSVGRVPLIVRARVAGWEHGIIRYDVERVIYGDFAGRTLLVDYCGIIEPMGKILRTEAGEDLGHEPTPTELEEYVLKYSGIEKGKEMIEYLIPSPAQPGQPSMYLSMGSTHDAPPEHRLDDKEDAIIRIIAEGKYLSPSFPQPADILEEHIRAANLIVRAQLVEVNETDSRWTVTDVIKGDAQEKTLILSHDLFRLRAEAVVRHTHRAEQPADEPTLKQEIAAEMKRLIEAELVPGRQAVLFASDPEVEDGAIRAHLHKRIYEDASGKRLDEAIRAIRDAQSHRLPIHL